MHRNLVILLAGALMFHGSKWPTNCDAGRTVPAPTRMMRRTGILGSMM